MASGNATCSGDSATCSSHGRHKLGTVANSCKLGLDLIRCLHMCFNFFFIEPQLVQIRGKLILAVRNSARKINSRLGHCNPAGYGSGNRIHIGIRTDRLTGGRKHTSSLVDDSLVSGKVVELLTIGSLDFFLSAGLECCQRVHVVHISFVLFGGKDVHGSLSVVDRVARHEGFCASRHRQARRLNRRHDFSFNFFQI